MIDAVLFDWDGTLLDSRDALLRAWHAATEEVLGRRFPASAADEALVFTLPGSELFPRVAGSAEGAAALTAAFARVYERSSEDVRPFPGIVSLLAELRAVGVAIAVVTSKARRRYDLDAHRIRVHELIDAAVCGGDAVANKPDPAPVRHALGLLGVEPTRAVMAGDTHVDLEAGAAAGTGVIGVAWGASSEAQLRAAGAAVIARDADELARLVLRGIPEMERIAT